MAKAITLWSNCTAHRSSSNEYPENLTHQNCTLTKKRYLGVYFQCFVVFRSGCISFFPLSSLNNSVLTHSALPFLQSSSTFSCHSSLSYLEDIYEKETRETHAVHCLLHNVVMLAIKVVM